MEGWRVAEEKSLSQYRHIAFKLVLADKELRDQLVDFPKGYEAEEELELTAKFLQRVIIS